MCEHEKARFRGIRRRVQTLTSRSKAKRDLRNRQAMLELLRRSWVKGVLEQSLHRAAMIELGLEQRADAFARPWSSVLRTPDQPDRMLPSGTSIRDIFDERGQTLLILGEPGSGKTTTLLDLAYNTIARAEQDLSQPIPVVLNLSSWAGEELALSDWLVNELNSKYCIPQSIARAWVENDDLLLLLDGLDEVKPGHREACVRVINAFRQEHRPVPMVVCSRSEDYHALKNGLELQGTLILQPLTPEQIDQYLEGPGVGLAAVRRTLRRYPALQGLAQSPLMLNIITLAYRGVSVRVPQGFDTIEDHRRHVFEDYVQRMLERPEGSKLYSPGQVKRWLTSLARKMGQQRQTVFMLEQMQPSWLQTSAQRRGYQAIHPLIGGSAGAALWALIGKQDVSVNWVVIALLVLLGLWGALTGGFWGGFFAGMVGATIGRWMGGRAVGLITGHCAGLIAGLIAGSKDRLNLRHLIKQIEGRWLPKRWLKGLVVGLLAGWIIVLGKELIAGPNDRLTAILFRAFVTWLTWRGPLWGSAVGLLIGGLSETEIDIRPIPSQGIRRSSERSLLIILTLGLPVGLNIGAAQMLGWTIPEDETSLAGMFVGCLVLGLIAGYPAVQHLVLRFLLYCGGHVPWHYAHFLDYAAECNLLRKVGGGYIFVHRFLQEYFCRED